MRLWSSLNRIQVSADGHHHEIGHHLVFADEGAIGLAHFGNFVAFRGDEIVVGRGCTFPMPRDFESVKISRRM